MNKILFLVLVVVCFFSCEVKLQENKAIDTVMINKMVYLNANLENGFGVMRNYSDELLVSVKKTVERKGNPPEGMRIIQKAENLKRTSANLLGGINKTKNDVFNKIGGGPFNKFSHFVERPAQTNGIYEMMIGNKKDGKGYLLQKELDEYITYLNRDFANYQPPYEIMKLEKFETLTEDYKNDYVAQQKDTTNKTDFALYHFRNATVIEALLTLTSKQIEVVRYEIKCLEKLNRLAERLPKE